MSGCYGTGLTIKNWGKTLLLIGGLLCLMRTVCFSQEPENLAFNFALSNEGLDIYPFSSLYKLYNDRRQLDSIFEWIRPQIKKVEQQQLHLLAYCNAIDIMGDHNEALELLSEINTHLSTQHIIVQSEYYSVMGNIALSSMNPEMALKHYQQSLDVLLKDEAISEEIIQAKYMSIGKGLNALEQPSKAKEIFEKALSLEKMGVNRNSLYLRLNMALTQSNLGELEGAKAYFKAALHMIKLNKDAFAEIRTLGNLADIYLKQDSLALAESFYTAGLHRAKEEGFNLDLIRFERSLSLLFEKTGHYQKAYKHLLASDSINEKLNSLDISEQLVKMEMQHKIQKEKIQKELNQELLETKSRQNLILLCFALILLGLCLTLFWQLNQLRQKNQILLQQNLVSIKENLPKENLIPSNDYQALLEALAIEIKEHKIYTDAALTLELLAKKLQTNRTYLSEAINSNFQMSFSRWLNEIRISESKKMLASSDFDQYSIEGIASMVGYSSISAYNSNFKKITGITPSYFRKNRSFREE